MRKDTKCGRRRGFRAVLGVGHLGGRGRGLRRLQRPGREIDEVRGVRRIPAHQNHRPRWIVQHIQVSRMRVAVLPSPLPTNPLEGILLPIARRPRISAGAASADDALRPEFRAHPTCTHRDESVLGCNHSLFSVFRRKFATALRTESAFLQCTCANGKKVRALW